MAHRPSQIEQKGASAGDEQPAPAASEIRPGWSRPEHIGLPQPTYWPAVLALGIAFLAWGLVTSWTIGGVGLVLFVLALAGWIGDLRHGH